MFQKMRGLGPKVTAFFFALWMGVFLFAWSLLVSDDSFASSLVGAVVGAGVAGGLFFWISSIASG